MMTPLAGNKEASETQAGRTWMNMLRTANHTAQRGPYEVLAALASFSAISAHSCSHLLYFLLDSKVYVEYKWDGAEKFWKN